MHYKKALKLRIGDRVIRKSTGEVMTIVWKALSEAGETPVMLCCYGEKSGHVVLNHKQFWEKEDIKEVKHV